MRVLVTGSRDWPEAQSSTIENDLITLLKFDDVKILTVVHGACPTGADLAARAFCRRWGGFSTFLGKDVIEEPHSAAWTTYGKKAGPIRNSEMVTLGADLCLAYPLGVSQGTRDCMAKAERVGITVWNRSKELGLDRL